MTFTTLHRALGVNPGPLTDQMLDDAVGASVRETNDLDWKSSLPPEKGLPQTDFPKDVAAMANSGGGVIVYGVRESQKAATDRCDVGEFSETWERALRSAAITAITPPVFGLNVHRLGDERRRAVAVEVPASIDGPHMIYKGEYFGAPIRNDADTVWMRERQIETMYRARFDERRHAAEALDALYNEASAGRDTEQNAWLVAVAHPRIPRLGERLTREQARAVLQDAKELTLTYATSERFHPLARVDVLNPRPGLRRWVAATGESRIWGEARASTHDDGSVTVAAAIGGRPVRHDQYLGGWQVLASDLECAIADLMALIRTTAKATDTDEYEVRVGLVWTGEEPMTFPMLDAWGVRDDGSIPMHHYTPVETSVNAAEPDVDYHWHLHDLAQDCVNQGGIFELHTIHPPAREDGR